MAVRNMLAAYNVSTEDAETSEANRQMNLAGEDSMEADMLDIMEAYQDVVAIEEDIGTMEESAAGLEQLQDAMNYSLEHNGGMDHVSAQMMHFAFDGYAGRVGASTESLPALESFGGDTGKQNATTVSLEAVSDTLKKIWNAIKEAVEKAIKAVSDFFAKIFQGIDKIISRIDALKKDVADLKDKELKKNAKISVSSPNSLQVAGKVEFGALKQGFQNLKTINEGTFGGYLDKASSVYKEVADEATKIKDKDEEKAAEEALRSISQTKDAVWKEIEKIQSKVMPGDKAFLVTEVSESGEGKETEYEFGDAKGRKSFSGKAEIDAMSQSQLEELLGLFEDVAKYVKDSKSKIEEVKKARKKAIEDMNKIVKDSDRGKIGKVYTKGKGRMVLRQAQKDMLKPVTKLVQHDMSVLRSGLKVVSSGTKQFKDKGSDDDDDSSGSDDS